jgi:hypothetical protein
MIVRTRNENADIANTYSAIPLNGSSIANLTEFRGTARNSEFSLLIQGTAGTTKLTGYLETDFLGAAPTANYVESNSSTPRLRELWIQLDKPSGWTITSSQTWSLLTGPRPIKRIPRNSNPLRDLIGGRESDPIDVLRQHVRIAPHLLDCLLPIGLEDSHRSASAHTMAVQEQHDFSYLFRFLPCLLNSLPAFGPDPVDGLQFRDPVLDHAQDFGSEPPDELLG